jgi:hypothetical protein
MQDIPNKHLWTTENGQSSSLMSGRGASNPPPHRNKQYATKRHTGMGLYGIYATENGTR